MSSTCARSCASKTLCFHIAAVQPKGAFGICPTVDPHSRIQQSLWANFCRANTSLGSPAGSNENICTYSNLGVENLSLHLAFLWSCSKTSKSCTHLLHARTGEGPSPSVRPHRVVRVAGDLQPWRSCYAGPTTGSTGSVAASKPMDPKDPPSDRVAERPRRQRAVAVFFTERVGFWRRVRESSCRCIFSFFFFAEDFAGCWEKR